MSDEDLQGVPGEHLLFEGLVARLIADIRCPTPLPYDTKKVAGKTTTLDQLLAVESIVDEAGGVVEWAELLGLDGSAVREHLLREAGLA
jgi:hypothetical protein